jgi:hypothetical protein
LWQRCYQETPWTSSSINLLISFTGKTLFCRAICLTVFPSAKASSATAGAFCYLSRCRYDRLCESGIEQSEIQISLRCALLDDGESPNQRPGETQAVEREVLHSALSLGSVLSIFRDHYFPHAVELCSVFLFLPLG